MKVYDSPWIQVAHFKIPRHMRLVDEFPKTPSGKVQKFKMREAEAKLRNLSEKN